MPWVWARQTRGSSVGAQRGFDCPQCTHPPTAPLQYLGGFAGPQGFPARGHCPASTAWGFPQAARSTRCHSLRAAHDCLCRSPAGPGHPRCRPGPKGSRTLPLLARRQHTSQSPTRSASSPAPLQAQYCAGAFRCPLQARRRWAQGQCHTATQNVQRCQCHQHEGTQNLQTWRPLAC